MNKIKNKMINRLYGIVAILTITMTMLFSACVKDLNVEPINPNLLTANQVYKSLADYNSALAKLYGGYVIADGDISAINSDGAFDGYSIFTRVVWMTQEDWTDEAWWVWYNDVGLVDMKTATFNDLSIWPQAMYYRIMFEVLLCNQFLKDAADGELSKKAGLSDIDKQTIAGYRNEARFLRALAYYYGLDNFRRMPFVTENDAVGAFFPKQATAQELFNYIESELKELETLLPDPSVSTLARTDKAAVWALLAKLYINAGVYLGYDGTANNTTVRNPTTQELDNCITYCNKIINDGYHRLSTTSVSGGTFTPFQELFMGDNGKNENAQREFILSFANDHSRIQSDGSSNIIINGFYGSPLPTQTYGVSGGWSCLSVREKALSLFTNLTNTGNGVTAEVTSPDDNRALFYNKGDGQQIEVIGAGAFTKGFSSIKFRGDYADPTLTYPNDAFYNEATNVYYFNNKYDTYYPVIRMGDIYLTLAEAQYRQGDNANALSNINLVRARANATPATSVDLAYIRDERGRELQFEGWRRTDLIRLGFFAGSTGYTWDYKGGANYAGQDIGMKYIIFAIPASDLTANPNLTQNYGY